MARVTQQILKTGDHTSPKVERTWLPEGDERREEIHTFTDHRAFLRKISEIKREAEGPLSEETWSRFRIYRKPSELPL